MSKKIMKQALDALKTCEWDYDYEEESYQTFDNDLVNDAVDALEAKLSKPANEFKPDWDTLQPYHDRIAELEAQLALYKKADNARELGLDYEPEQPELRKAMKMALEALEKGTTGLAIRAIPALRHALAQHGFDTPESHIVKWSIPVDPNNFGEALAQPEQEPIQAINDVIDYLYSTGADNDMANRAHIALKQLQMNLRDQTALHLLYKGDYEDLIAQPEQDHGFDRTASHMAGEYVDTAEQEPVCWITPDGEGFRMRFDPPVNDVPMGWTPLYALGDEK